MVLILGQEYDIDTTIVLIISNKKLKEIPLEVFQLVNLQKFNCSSNQIEIIPIEIGNLINLQIFDCYNNQIKIIPIEIEKPSTTSSHSSTKHKPHRNSSKKKSSASKSAGKTKVKPSSSHVRIFCDNETGS